MEWFDWLKSGRVAGQRRTVEEQLASIIEEEEHSLQRLGIPLPPRREAIRASITGLRMPVFDLSRYLFLPVQAKAGDYIGYLVRAELTELRHARFVLKNSGAHELVEHFPGLWLNRDPYALYKNVSWYGAYGPGFSSDADLLTWLKVPPLLWKVRGFSPDEVYDRITWRARFFSAALENQKFPLAVESLEIPSVKCTDAFQLAATVPAKAVRPARPPDRWTAAQITGCGTPTQATFNRFLEGLRKCNDYFALEAIADEGSLNLQLAFHPSHGDTVLRQIEEYLPGAIAREVAGASRVPENLQWIAVCLNSPFGVLNPSEAPPRLPCDVLRPVFREGSVRHFCCVQVIFAPLSLDFFLHLRQELQPINVEDYSSAGLEEFAGNFPGWMVSIKLFATRPDVFHSICNGWLRTYVSGSREWIFSLARVVSGVDRKPDVCEVEDTGELANILYAPACAIGNGLV